MNIKNIIIDQIISIGANREIDVFGLAIILRERYKKEYNTIYSYYSNNEWINAIFLHADSEFYRIGINLTVVPTRAYRERPTLGVPAYSPPFVDVPPIEPGERTSPGKVAPSAKAEEGPSITRYPAIMPDGPAKAGQLLAFSVDLARRRPKSGSKDPIKFTGLDPDWAELQVDVFVSSIHLDFEAGGDAGRVIVRRNNDSQPCTFRATVTQEARLLKSIQVQAAFFANGRFSGSYMQSISTAGPSPSVRTRRPRQSVRIVGKPPGLTAYVRLANMAQGTLDWKLIVPRECYSWPGMPRDLTGISQIGGKHDEDIRGFLHAAARSQPGEHEDFFHGFGEFLYSHCTPPSFKEAYWALRRKERRFPIQFILLRHGRFSCNGPLGHCRDRIRGEGGHRHGSLLTRRSTVVR